MITALLRLIHALAAGAVGGTAVALAFWGLSGWEAAWEHGFTLSVNFTRDYLAARVVAGAILGPALLLPFWQNSYMAKGLVISFLPTAWILFHQFPSRGYGVMGFELGGAAAMFVLVVNALGGLTAGLALRLLSR
jgi:hypothetical protein